MYGFYGQFILHGQPKTLSQGWETLQIDRFQLETHPALPVTPIMTPDSCRVGVFLGYPISPENRYMPRVASVPSGLSNADALEEWLYAWRGRYVAIVSLPTVGTRLYLDAIGSMSCVYSVTQGFCASSPLLVPSVTWDEELIRTYGMPQSGRFYPAGMLPFDDIRRLMPNFYLDVDKMMPYRHYPKHDFKRTDDTEMLIAQIQSRLSDNIRSVAREHDTYLSLTAGRDSRMLLAAARDGVARAEFFTYDDAKETVDLHVAKKIAAKYKLSWRALPATHSSPEALNQWQVDVGHCVAGAIWRHSPSFAQLGPGRVRMPGLGGEIGRCFYWRPHDRADSTLSPVDLLARMKLPTDDMSLWNMETWIKSIPAWLNAYDVLDLAYIEHRLGCWAGPALYGSDQYFAGQLVPFGDRYIIERMLSLPPEYRLQQGMARDIIRQAWPELLELLFNRYTGIRRYCSRHGMRSYARQLKRAMQRR